LNRTPFPILFPLALLSFGCCFAAAQAPAQTDTASGQPDLKAVKIDFVPGEKTVFLDDFSDMGEDEPPVHWKITGGKVELRKGEGTRQLTTVCPARVTMNSAPIAFPKNFTTELEVAFGAEYPSIDFLAWPKGVEGGQQPSWTIRVSGGDVRFYGPNNDKIGDKHFDHPAVNKPIKVALWVQEGRARGYVDGERVGDTNQEFLPKGMAQPDHWTVRERCDRPTDLWMGIRSVRVAESTPDFSTVFSQTGKYVTHGITFDTDSDRLKPESAAVVKMVYRALDSNPNLKLSIAGYTDSVGDAKHNLDLSQRRADAVKAVLVQQFGVDASRLTAKGNGAGSPIGSNDTAEGRAENRRVEFAKQ
jgi:OmpA-OmpF porin, OOP family